MQLHIFMYYTLVYESSIDKNTHAHTLYVGLVCMEMDLMTGLLYQTLVVVRKCCIC